MGFCSRLCAQTVFGRRARPRPPAAHPLALFGTDTARPGAKGIYSAHFDPVTGRFSEPTLAVETLRPSYFATNQVTVQGQARHVLYVANEGDAHTSAISTFLFDPGSGSLKAAGQVSSGGAGPCFLAVDPAGQSAYVANYSGGSIASYKVLPEGTLSAPVEVVDFHKPAFGHRGPNAARQEGPHPHCAMLSPENRFLLVCDLGSDEIAIFPVETESGRLGAPSLNEDRSPGAGPRHCAFHPNGRWVYGIDELASRIDHFLWNATHPAAGAESQARLTDTGHSVSTLDPRFHETNTAAEIVLSPDGHFVYASNRGENSLVVFRIDELTGELSLAQGISCGGKVPRHLTLDPSGAWLVCGNQDSASVTVFRRDPASGRLSGPVQTLPLESPMFTLFV